MATLFTLPISYRIPHFQRPYCWNRERQWEPLWEDITNLAARYEEQNEQTRSHFMGAIVVQRQKDRTGEVRKRLVIDGQQRLITLQLVLRATAEAFKARGEEERGNRLQALTQNDPNYFGGESDNWVKIRSTNTGDREAFHAAMQDRLDDTSDLGKGYRYFRTEVEKWLNSEPLLQSRKFEALESILSHHLKLTSIDLNEEEEPYAIFATLNDRGEHLGPADIIKNMMMQRARVADDDCKAKRVWGIFEEDTWWRRRTGENNLRRSQTDRFLDHWVTIRTGKGLRHPGRLPADLNNFLEKIGKNRIWEAVDDLNARAETYRRIHEGTLQEARIFLQRMQAFNVGAPMATMLWLYTANVPEETQGFVQEAIESYIIRRKLAGMTTNPLREVFGALIAKIFEADMAGISRMVVEHLSREKPVKVRWPGDSELVQYLCDNPLPGQDRGKKVILTAIEEHLRSDKSEPLGDMRALTLEHIMPRKWPVHWPLSTDTQDPATAKLVRDRTVNFIGNLTLVTRSLNSSTRNRPWPDKRSELESHSTLAMNRILLQEAPDVWNEPAIRDRSRKLADLVVAIWPGPDSYRKDVNI